MLQPNFTPFPTITTGRLILREVTTKDADDIFFLRSNEAVLKYLDKEPEKSVEETIAWTEIVKQNQDNNDGILWGITLHESNIVIGTICYWRMQKEHYRAEIGYALHPAHQGRGIMDEAIKAVLHYGFKIMGLHSVEANINPANEASGKLLEKNGFVQEAYFRENYYFNGKFIDSVIYSLLAPKN